MFEYEDASNKRRIKLTLLELFQEHGVTGILAILVVGTACFIAISQSWRGSEINLPKYFTELSTLIIGYYFGKTRSGRSKR